MKKRPAIKFTPAEDELILANYMALSFGEIAVKLNRGRTSIRNRLIKLGVEITPKMTKRRWFKKGHRSPNKGKKQTDFCSPEHIASLKKVCFQPGHKPLNEKKELEPILRCQSNGKLYYWVKVERKWIQYHIYLWRKAGKEIPEGHIVVFKDNDPLHCWIENLECITRAESLARNKLINWTTRRNDLPLSERRSKKYRDKKKKILKLRKSIIKKETAITKKKQRAFTKQRKREELLEQKKLRSVSRRDEISWSKKIFAKHSIVIPDSSKLIPLRVDHKTILYVKPGADVEAILKMYQKKAS